MNTGSLLTGLGLGAALAFALDPNTGTRRRALLRDRLARASRKTRHGLDTTARDVANRTRGIAATTRARFSNEEVDDQRLRERVRAQLGRSCSHPRAIDVHVHNGQVTLRGPILSDELTPLLNAVATIRGVQSVDSELEGYDSSDGVPALQGRVHGASSRPDILHRHWAPATQALVAVAGLAATGMWLSHARR
jgi:hypothetical protein